MKPQQRKKRVREKGIVMSVPSGDRIVVYLSRKQEVGAKWKPPAKMEVKLSWVQAPRAAATWTEIDEETKEEEEKSRDVEAFYWKSREFLRKKVIGKIVEIEVFSKNDNQTKRVVPRVLGNVWLKDKESESDLDLAFMIVEAGWAHIKVPEKMKDNLPARLKKLQDLEEKAKTDSLGIHNEALAKKNQNEPVRDFDQWEKFLEWKGKSKKGVVENVIDGSMMIVTISPKLETIRIKISGVRAPRLRKEKREPFAVESQHTTERFTLHRDVQVIVSSFDRDRAEEGEPQPKSGVFHGEIYYQKSSIGELLLKSGLAKYVEWSAPPEKRSKYAALQQQAQKRRLRMWSVRSNLVKASEESGKTGDRKFFNGRVCGVISGSTINVEFKKSVVMVTISGINVPRMGRDGSPHEPMAWEAREHIRKMIIGKVVRCIEDYTVPERKLESGKVLKAKTFYTVEYNKKNLALGLIQNGLATVLETFGDNKSLSYNEFIMAQEIARKKRVGLHQKGRLPKQFTNDISRDAKKAKSMYQRIAKKAKHNAIVEYVISGNKMKLKLVEDNLIISFVLSGCRSNSVPRQKKGEPAKEIPPFAQEAVDFTRNLCHNFDVVIEIDGQDKTGAFKGYMWIKKKNVAIELLKLGYARCIRSKRFEDEFEAAEKIAKDGKKGIWKSFVKREQKEKKESEAQPVKAVVEVTEVKDGGWFYCQVLGGDDKALLDELMEIIAKENLDDKPPVEADRGDNVLAKFSGDGVWYRARVMSTNPTKGTVKVFYGDYGNVDWIPKKYIRKMGQEYNLQKLRFQARECSLAFIKPRKLNQDWGEKAALVLKKLVWGKQLKAIIEYTQQGVFYLSLWDKQLYINGELVRKGLARVDRPRKGANRELIKFLREQEEIAHDKHKGIWIHGDPGSSDEED